MRLLTAIPALNEEATIGDLIERLPRAIDGVTEVHVLVVDDGSTDSTAEKAREAGAQVISHPHNKGLGLAFQSAVAAALRGRYDVMVTIDADGQFDPEEIPKLARPIIKGQADFVSGNRFYEGSRRPKNMPKVKYVGNAMMSWLVGKVAGTQFDDVSCGFRAYAQDALLWLNTHGAFTYTQEVFLDLASKDLRIMHVPITVKYHDQRDSRIADNIVHYAINTSKIIFRTFRDHRPLVFSFIIAGTFLIVAFVLGSFVLYHYLTTGTFSPYIFIAFTATYIGTLGVITIIAGVFADMLDRLRINQERILYLMKRQGIGIQVDPIFNSTFTSDDEKISGAKNDN